jgi:uncharacterized damage-inducible protein DinB
MRVKVGLELNNEGRAQAWALDYPGCFAYGTEGTEAVIALARALSDYELWANRHGGDGWITIGDYDLRIVDTWDVYTINDDYEVQEGGYAVNAWFRDDWRPLTVDEVERGLKLLEWSRADLLHVVGFLSEEQLDQQKPGERWSIRGILKHIANAEWWYMDRLGQAGSDRKDLPQDAIERLRFVRERFCALLPDLVEKNQVVGVEGEFWSPRKLLRRTLWHERDHIHHIRNLVLPVL